MGNLYTPELLRKFDLLTMKLSSRDQLERINARLDLSEFQKEHGKEVCDAMFAELVARDKKTARRDRR